MNGRSKQLFTVVRAPALDVGRITALLRQGFHEEPVQHWLFPRSICRTVLNWLWFREVAMVAVHEGTICMIGRLLPWRGLAPARACRRACLEAEAARILPGNQSAGQEIETVSGSRVGEEAP